jgi:DNA-binding FadR family transcriptional regulator
MQVADQLRDLITRGDLAVGQRLPSETELAPLFGVSKSTIREALRILVTDGLVETRRGATGGTFVADVDPARIEGILTSAFNHLAGTAKASAADFLTAWKALEVPATGLAAQRRGGDLLDKLRRACEVLPAETPRPVRLDQSAGFHSTLLAACGNLLLEAMGRPISAVARARFSRTDPTNAFWSRNTAEHRRIYEAIATGDRKAAEKEAAAHIDSLTAFYSGRSA